MAVTISGKVLAEAVMPQDGAGLAVKRAVLLALGVAALVVAAKIRVPLWPVPVTMQTFAVLTIGAAYGARLGSATVIGYLALGALGFDVFTASSAGRHTCSAAPAAISRAMWSPRWRSGPLPGAVGTARPGR